MAITDIQAKPPRCLICANGFTPLALHSHQRQHEAETEGPPEQVLPSVAGSGTPHAKHAKTQDEAGQHDEGTADQMLPYGEGRIECQMGGLSGRTSASKLRRDFSPLQCTMAQGREWTST